jgi:serine/threonine-protein kinase RsbW
MPPVRPDEEPDRMNVPAANPPPVATRSRRIPSEAESCRRLWKDLLAEVESQGFAPDDVHAIGFAVLEALANALKHGSRFDPACSIEVAWSLDPLRFAVTIADEGDGFDPAAVPDPASPAGLEKDSGRGLAIMRRMMDEIRHNAQGNAVTLIKHRRR